MCTASNSGSVGRKGIVMEKSSFGISSFGLRVIAVILMTIDHIGAVLFPHVLILRIIGRLSFPIFVFLMVEGYFHTRDVKKYLTRLLVFAVISEPFFDVVFHHSLLYARGQNIFMTLFLGLLMVHICEKTTNKGFNVFTVLIIGLIAEIGYCQCGGQLRHGCQQALRENVLRRSGHDDEKKNAQSSW